ncbi:hypothetical protein TWF481_004119 [Arthrobotrys musiformis]|uniref:Uncharacterized protein n=1 Tax=Arthrobotrys musiformis TaxID=47236 RepID=A0AAV9WJU4_9PEZI
MFDAMTPQTCLALSACSFGPRRALSSAWVANSAIGELGADQHLYVRLTILDAQLLKIRPRIVKLARAGSGRSRLRRLHFSKPELKPEAQFQATVIEFQTQRKERHGSNKTSDITLQQRQLLRGWFLFLTGSEPLGGYRTRMVYAYAG